MKTILKTLLALMFVVGLGNVANAQGSFQRVLPPTGFAEQGDTKVYICISSATTFPCAGGDLASIYSDRALTSAITQTSGRSVSKNSQEVVYYIAPGLYQEVFYSATMGFYYGRLFNAPGDATLLNASVARIVDPTDPTKKIAFTASGNATASTLTLASVVAADRTVSILDYGAASVVLGSLLTTNKPEVANSAWGVSNGIAFEGATADAFELTLAPADVAADTTITFPGGSGTVMLSSLATNAIDVVNSVTGASNALVLEGATADAFETSITPVDATADRTITLPNASLTLGDTTVSWAQGGVVANAEDSIFFIADRAYTVTGINAVWSVAETTGSMDIMPEKLTGTTACGSGNDLLSAAVAGTGTANTVTAGSLTATGADLDLAAGDRICVDLSATPNEVKNITVTVKLKVK